MALVALPPSNLQHDERVFRRCKAPSQLGAPGGRDFRVSLDRTVNHPVIDTRQERLERCSGPVAVRNDEVRR